MNQKEYYLYIITNYEETVLYTGVTNNLQRRMYEHANKLIEGFSKRYKLDKLVYYENYNDINDAILREKQIKAGSRKKKEELIRTLNPQWLNLYEDMD